MGVVFSSPLYNFTKSSLSFILAIIEVLGSYAPLVFK
jgi:hypothetical protein